MPYTRPATIQDAQDLAPRLREADIQELWALAHISPFRALEAGVVESDESHTVVADDGCLIGMFGINHIPQFGADQAAVWMLATDDLRSIRTEFMRQTAPILAGFHRKYPMLWNVVDARNEVHIRWLKRFGFVALRLHPRLGLEQQPFYEFIRIDPSCVIP